MTMTPKNDGKYQELFVTQAAFVNRTRFLFCFEFLPVYFFAGSLVAESMAFKLLKYVP